jgi:hypothetical protein
MPGDPERHRGLRFLMPKDRHVTSEQVPDDYNVVVPVTTQL